MFLCLPLFSHAAEKFYVQVPAVLDPSAPIVNAVKNECGLELLIGNYVFQRVNERMGGADPLQDIAKAGQNKVLQLTIISVQGVGGGAWSGGKAISLRAQIVQNGQTLNTVVFRRNSRGGVFGGMQGTCTIMEHIVTFLAKDVAAWVPGALSGNATSSTDGSPNKFQSNESVTTELKQ